MSGNYRAQYDSRPAAAMRTRAHVTDLFATTTGDGPNIVLLHGWGFHSGVWDGVLARLASRWRITCIDLPGHGQSSAGLDLRALDAVCAQLHEAISDRVICVGWSLGGLIATSYALRYPQSVRRLILVASQPRFTRASNWPHALSASMLRRFGETLKRDHQTALMRFLALQVQASDNRQSTLRRLHAVVNAYSPNHAALYAGLELLRETDLRARLSKVACPARMILGARDKLVPVKSGGVVAALFKNGRCAIIPGAGHAPFLSHPLAFMRALETFLDD
jgi:pimeloyl-[acyl-carrier protein] methyl ester esterase